MRRKKLTEGELNGILGYSEEPLVSGDYNGNANSSTIDALSTMVMEGKDGESHFLVR